MNRFLLALLLIAPVALTAQENANYDPDINGDGCYTIADILGLLSLFEYCAPQPFQCGDSIQFDNYWYVTVPIGDQCWFEENLRTTIYANGEEIPSNLDGEAWDSATGGAVATYGEGMSPCGESSPGINACDDAQSLTAYGRLYNWYAVDDGRGLCPAGWHVPTDEEWTAMENHVAQQGFTGFEGEALKTVSGWNNNGNGTDDFGFSGIPGGFRDNASGTFSSAGNSGRWWSSTSNVDNRAWRRRLSSDTTIVDRYNSEKQLGFSVRCMLNADALGCTDPSYLEYNPAATVDNGSCTTMVVMGCTDPDAVNYAPCANTDDGSCCLSPTMDGHTYDVVEIGDQCWFAENLRTTVYSNGDLIPAGLTGAEWSSTTAGATAVYGEGSSDCYDMSPDIDACDEAQSLAAYGRLYNWYAVGDARGLCPGGWHVPTDGEWTQLEDYITSQGFNFTEGVALKSTSGWFGGGNGTDNFGFSALSGGYRLSGIDIFDHAGIYGLWWSSSQVGVYDLGIDDYAWSRYLNYDNPYIHRDVYSPEAGSSVRCLRDAE